MEEKSQTTKIVIDTEHELTDLVREIHRTKADRIVLTFTEHTDLLISPINLKVISEAAQRENKLLIAQIIQNPIGIRNAKLAGIKTIDTPSNPTEYEWEEASELIISKKREKLERKKILETVAIQPDQKEVFEEKVEENIEKSIPTKEDIKEETGQEPIKKDYIDKRGLKTRSPFISIDQDMPSAPIEEPINIVDEKRKPSFKLKNAVSIKRILPNIKTNGNFNKKKVLRIFLFIFVPLLLLSILGGFLFNEFGTFVKIKIFVESKPVAIESVLTGDSEIDKIDFEELKIPIKTEEASKGISNTITATGVASKGEKAEGKVTVTYFVTCEEDTPDITLPVGQIITSPGGKTYSLKTSVSVGCSSSMSADNISIIATEFGKEYNLSNINQTFSITGYSSDDLFAKNTTTISGGTTEEYTVLSQTDVDNGVEALSETAIEEVKSELRENSGDWEIIEDSILSSVDKASIKTDKKVGEEATDVNLDLTVKGTATYFKTDGLTEGLKELLRKKAEEDNLFESDKDIELELSEDITKSVTVEEVKKDSVKIKIVASANIKPKIDKDELLKELAGLSWDEGKNYLNELNYAQKNPEVIFNPMNYPQFLKRYSKREGRVLIELKEIEVEAESE
ncbi:MAG TPA: hypothetical protein P5059_01980 [Candidatus Dojkabacteria bacterium]|nr:hypothetical protein [Candidatus Dojkabacteria bacterium]